MYSALNKLYAAVGARLQGAARLRPFVLLCSVACASAAVAGPGNGSGPGDGSGPHQGRRDGPPQQRAERPMPAQPQAQPAPQRETAHPDPRNFDARAEEIRRAQQQQQQQGDPAARAEAFRRNGRLTPDERRDLRRQINEAGAEVYGKTPRH